MRNGNAYLLFLAVCNVLFFRKLTHRELSTKQKLFVAREFKRLNGKTKTKIPHPLSLKKETSSIRSACESFNFQIEFCQGNFPLPFPARVTRLIDPLESPSTSKSRSIQDLGVTMYRQLILPLSLTINSFYSQNPTMCKLKDSHIKDTCVCVQLRV